MKRKGNNDLAMAYIIEMLRSTDYDRPMLYQQIEETLRDEYGLDLDRRTVAAKINLLVEEGFVVRKGLKSGVYFDNRDFLSEELDLLIYSVMANRNIPPVLARDLADRISELGGKSYIPMVDYFKTLLPDAGSDARAKDSRGSYELFLDLEVIYRAIRNNQQISFDYCRFGKDKKLHVESTHIASPYYVMMDREFWLIAYSDRLETVSSFRIDRIRNISILKKKRVVLETVHGFELGLDTERIRSSLPYAFNDEIVRIKLRADEDIIDDIVDCFGNRAEFKRTPKDGSGVIVEVRTSPKAMEHWAKQYMDHVEIIKPVSLRNRIRESLENSMNKYSKEK